MDGVEGAAPFARMMSNVSLVLGSGEYSQPAYLFGVDIDTLAALLPRWSGKSSKEDSISGFRTLDCSLERFSAG